MPNTVQLKKNGQPVFPVTDVSLVMGLAERPLMDAVYAWDGTGTPDITKIPAGVTVEYNSTTYTGTLAASADTTARFYLVPSTTVPGEYDRYLTDAVSGSYSWKSAGTTAIPTPSIVDNLESTDPTKALSAKQGKVLNEELGELEANLMSARAKNALLAVFNKVAFAVPDVSAEMSELNNALFNLDEVTGINAVYTQGSTVIWSDGVSVLNDLKANLVVKAEYGDGTEVTVTNYTLSGTLTTGTSVITVEYEGFTTTFNVTVTKFGTKMSYTMTLGEVLRYNGAATGSQEGVRYIDTANNKRRVFVLNYGKTKLIDGNGNLTNYYPIPVPQGATTIRVSVTPNTFYIAIQSGFLHNGVYYSKYDYASGAAPTINPGWWQGSGSFDLTTVQNREELYLLINCKNASDTVITTEPTNLIITFE